MSASSDEAPTGRVSLAEVHRMLLDMRAELRTTVGGIQAALGSLVRADVYQEARAADHARLARLESELDKVRDDRQQDRRMRSSSFLVSVGTFLASLTMFIIALVVHH
jgi:hypothetical protein